MTNENDDYLDEYLDEEDNEDRDPNCYSCSCCGHSQVNRPAFGGMCPKCGAIMEEDYI